MTIALKDKWIWDSWYVRDGETWHAYFLQAEKSLGDPDLRHFNVSHGHAVSTDLKTWEHKGQCFSPSEVPSWDDTTTWTGSVVQDGDGLWHYFYTGGGSAEKGLYQRIGHATSHDLHSWERVGTGLCLDLIGENADYYEKDHIEGHWYDRAMRDPWVMRDPDGSGWLMYFTARAADIKDTKQAGCIGFARSEDLMTWHLAPPVFTGHFSQIEVPQVFEQNGRWYCLFCVGTKDWSEPQIVYYGGQPIAGNHYLIGESPTGPWKMAPGFLDGADPCQRYAARILFTDTGAKIMGFLDTGHDSFVGEIMAPQDVLFDEDGLMVLAD